MSPRAAEPFWRRHLDPADRINEVLFGLIMVLTFTLTAGLTVEDGPDAARELLIATLGCNVAWGIIDGAMFLTAALLERGHRVREITAVKAATDESSAHTVVSRALEGTFISFATEDDKQRVVPVIHDIVRRMPIEKVRMRKEDFYGALTSFLLVVLSTIPAAIPFLLVEAPRRALRVSNLLLVGLLFVVGLQWGRHAHVSPLGSGLAFLLAGLALVGVAIALGG